MALFLVFYLFTIILLNLYVFRWLRAGFCLRKRGILILAAFQLVMIFLPIAMHACRRLDFYELSRAFALVAYSWMAVVMWVVCFGFLAEIWNVGVALSALYHPARRRFRVSPVTLVRSISVLVIVFTIWGRIEARSLSLQTIEIETARLPPGTKPLRIVHLSDLHLGGMIQQRSFWNRMLEIVRSAKPDMIVSTGDFFESASKEINVYTDELAAIRPPLGKFAVLGNHEYYVKEAHSMRLLQRSGFEVLRAGNRVLSHDGSRVCIAGVDDPAGRHTGQTCKRDENLALPDKEDRPFTVLLKHQVLVDNRSKDRFDLQLSGHLHGGQIFPFQFFVWAAYGTFTGLRELDNGSHVFVSPGVGTWGPPLRVLAPPRVILIVVRPKE